MDARIAVWAATHRVAALNGLFVGLGTAEKLGLLWILAAVVVGWGRRWGFRWTLGLAVLTGLTTFAADSAAFGLKDLTNRPRPFEAHPQIHPLYVVHSSSFPAGHAATAFAGAAVLAYVVPRAAPFLAFVASSIGLSRVYVGVHYPTDVLAGAAVGLAVGGIGVLALRAARGTEGTSGEAPNVSS